MRTEDKVTLHAEPEFASVIGLSQLLSKISEDIKIRCPNWRWVLGIPQLIFLLQNLSSTLSCQLVPCSL